LTGMAKRNEFLLAREW